MPLTEITAAINSARATIAFVKGAKAAIDKVEISNQLAEIYDKIIAAQSQTLSLLSENVKLVQEKNDLNKKVVESENWQKTETEYELTEICPKRFIYVSKKSAESTQPEHWLCPNCWQQKKKSILQGKLERQYMCPACKFEFFNSNEPPPPSKPSVIPRRIGGFGRPSRW